MNANTIKAGGSVLCKVLRGDSRDIDRTANEQAALACISVHSRFLLLNRSGLND